MKAEGHLEKRGRSDRRLRTSSDILRFFSEEFALFLSSLSPSLSLRSLPFLSYKCPSLFSKTHGMRKTTRTSDRFSHFIQRTLVTSPRPIYSTSKTGTILRWCTVTPGSCILSSLHPSHTTSFRSLTLRNSIHSTSVTSPPFPPPRSPRVASLHFRSS